MIDALQDLTASLPTWLQWLGVVLAGAVPFVESYLGSALGVLAGLDPVVAVAAAVTGNVLTMLLAVLAAGALRRRTAGEQPAPETLSPRRQRMRQRFDRYGVAGVSLLGQTLLPSQVTAAVLVSFGARRGAVIGWQVASIVLWGVLFAVLTVLGVDLLSGRG